MQALPAFIAVDWNGTVVSFFGEPAYPGALDVLEAWRQKGILICVVSHAPPGTIQRDVERVGLAADEIYGVEEKEPVLKELRLRLGNGIYIGDHPSDFRAATAADLPFFQACQGGQIAFPGRDAGFSDWRELPGLLGY
ncbi:MAG: HAD family hydrolase [Planctomycetota bacterium]|jgi:phosphoglycolate phosphatase-like HAD superfamily hydrolase|nr:HAD family hydrolase [Planctomycetota bacterium]MDP6941479.1 HAD family hydrolase [Planctomycetota bacterium]